ncbi:MAG: hypothetical protein FWE02_04805, partial [Defluviitaleaceae bacterium]|nr:hypothetical protein [Defluviitaleaceae bacterium]
ENAMDRLQTSLSSITERLTQMDVLETLEERQIIANQIKQTVFTTIGTMNTNSSGRYIFSGLRTNEPPFFTTDMPNLILRDITMDFSGNDLQRTIVFNRVPSHQDPVEDGHTLNVYRIRIPHNNAEDVRLNGTAVPNIPMYGTTGEIDWDSMDPDTVYHDPRTGELISLNRNNFLDANGEVTVLYDREGFLRNELNPIVFMPVIIDCNPPRSLNMDNQQMEFEFSVNTRIPVNVLAKDAFNPIMFADILGIANDILVMRPTTHAELIERGMTDQGDRDEFLRREALMMETSSNDMLNRLIGRMEGYMTNVSRVEANLGARMTRVDSIGARLEADSVIFEELSTENIGVDLPSASMRFAVAEVALMASLQIGMSHVLNLSLLNFL